MKTTLAKILWKKEKAHWIMISQMFKRFNGWLSKLTFGFIVAVLVSISHYGFAFMHTLYEIGLFLFARKAFKRNLQRLSLKV